MAPDKTQSWMHVIRMAGALRRQGQEADLSEPSKERAGRRRAPKRAPAHTEAPLWAEVKQTHPDLLGEVLLQAADKTQSWRHVIRTADALRRQGQEADLSEPSKERAGRVRSPERRAAVEAAVEEEEEDDEEEEPAARQKRVAWIRYYVRLGETQKAHDLGWDGKPFAMDTDDDEGEEEDEEEQEGEAPEQDEAAENRRKRVEWIKYYIECGLPEKAYALGWDGVPFALDQ